MAHWKTVILGDFSEDGKQYRVMCSFNAIGELKLEEFCVETGMSRPAQALDAVCAAELHGVLSRLYNGEFEKEMRCDETIN